ncbi:hypothetical protein Slin14017_G099450 [Septoria linicola]|nr:hypothetical protein Slin14017_G099450 [Septoria linicola]
MRSCPHHKCAICWRDVDCDKRKRTIDGLWVDEDCWNKEDAQRGQALTRTKKSLASSHKAEAKSIGQDPDDKDNQIIYEECVSDIAERHKSDAPEGQYVDGCSESTFPIFQGFHPFNKSVDCVLPAKLNHRGQLRGHVAGNVLDIPFGLNMGKGPRVRNLPADVLSIATYSQDINTSLSDKQKRKRDVLEACNEHNQVQCKYRMNKAAALGKQMTVSDYANLRAEFVAGKVNSTDQEANLRAKEHAERLLRDVAVVSCAWDQDEVSSVKYFGIEARVTEWADDGAPWPFPDVPMPPVFKDQGMDILYSLLHLHMSRMRIYCNRYWATVDTELSLAAEMLYQNYIDPDGEFLSLPLSPYLWHALLMSIAHRHHGQQMRTGYGPKPTTLFSRNAALSNILFETLFSNTYKWDFEEKHYPQMKEYISKVVIPKQFYDPTVTAGSTFEGTPPRDELDYNLGIITRAVEEDVVAEHNRDDGDVVYESTN